MSDQLTIEQAADNHSRRSCVTHVQLNRSAQEIDNISFQAGAKWQKEQYKRLFEIAKGATQELQRVGSIVLSNQLQRQIDKFTNDTERLQD